ncbi:mRNA export factor-like [Acyrthosiphon pisum]|uniref:mRNA export factor n=1 Tax=Acyrthosiphon pisum TaxID=7029 RepID=A0A8R1W5M1_ACYPI|nr:mRNA export factor-like [Acyrthosiphon pisum]|eukprot:XP_001950323.2 PREDICTED: mRNA export factor-like [Acyrthosiphon pisum]
MSTESVSEAAAAANPNNDFEVTQPPDDTVSALEFSPATVQQTYLLSGGWDNTARCWEVGQNGQTEPKAMQSMSMPILDVCWSGDGTKVFMASCNQQVNCWDLASNQTMQVETHDAPVSTCHWIETPSYTCIMTCSWDKTFKLWDLRSSAPAMTVNLPERVYCADVGYPLVIFGTASRGFVFYNLEGTPSLSGSISSPSAHQHRCIAVFKDKVTKCPTGFGFGDCSGRLCIFLNIHKQRHQRENFSFKCHRHNIRGVRTTQNIYAVNDIKVHPVHGTIASVGSDGTFAFWNKETRTRLMVSSILDQPITKCCFNSDGQIFAYSSGYDWSKGHEYYNPALKPKIFLRPCFEEMKPKVVSTTD